MKKATERLESELAGAAHGLVSSAGELVNEFIHAGGAETEGIRERIRQMVSKVNTTMDAQQEGKFVGVNEDDILRYIPDRRSFNGIGALLVGLFLLVLLPGSAKWIAMLAFAWAVGQFAVGYVWKSKVDIPEGFQGVVCEFGKPIAENAHRGRNWLFSIRRFIPYMVSVRDQVVDATNVNFTGDYVTIGQGMQIVLRVVNFGKCVSNTTPSGAMKLVRLYAGYINLRMITSIGDARVKFTGRDNLENVITALNSYLAETCGFEVIRVNMPSVENSVLEDLEEIRTMLKGIESLQQTRTVQLESAIKAVEQTIRQLRIESRNAALSLQQTAIALETALGETVNERRQQLLMDARQTLDGKISELRRDIADLTGKVAQSRTINESLVGLRSTWKLRIAHLKQRTMVNLMPKRIDVLGVEGIGAGAGFSMGSELMRKLLQPATESKQ